MEYSPFMLSYSILFVLMFNIVFEMNIIIYEYSNSNFIRFYSLLYVIGWNTKKPLAHTSTSTSFIATTKRTNDVILFYFHWFQMARCIYINVRFMKTVHTLLFHLVFFRQSIRLWKVFDIFRQNNRKRKSIEPWY